jgi:hypothetical protein
MDFEVDCKRVGDSLYSNKNYASNFGAIVRNRRSLLDISFVNSHVKFIRTQVNEVAHRLAKKAPSLVSLLIYIDIPTCIYSIIMSEMR